MASEFHDPGFTVLIDTAESLPFAFRDLVADARHKNKPIRVETKHRCLGRHPHSLGDYSIEGFEHIVGIERKSREDIQGTILGFPKSIDGEVISTGRRDRFECELENLKFIRSVGGLGAVVVEAPMHECATMVQAFGKKSVEVCAKIINRSLIAFQYDYQIPWYFCANRQHAEMTTFQIMRRWLEKRREAEKRN